jgi:hypothetical protein
MCPTLVAPAAALLRSDWPLLRIARRLDRLHAVVNTTPQLDRTYQRGELGTAASRSTVTTVLTACSYLYTE